MREGSGPSAAQTPPLGLEALSRELGDWLNVRRASHLGYFALPREFGERVVILNALQRELFDAGFIRYGWPAQLGGLGGSVLHRAVVNDRLARSGYPPRHHFEHLDILQPALVRYGDPALVAKLFLPTLRGDVLWCQGFSEPTAGSDLAALRTRAEAVEGGYRIDGHKIWTSWAKWATHCLLLARTGSAEDRHRGLTAFVVEMDRKGVTAVPIRQANGTDELAEVFFESVWVPAENRVGEEGQGWDVAMHILAGERGSFTWQRQADTLPKLERLARAPRAADCAAALGESLTRLLALRCRSRSVMEILARGEAPGPESSVTKVLVIDVDQHFYDVAREVLSPELDLGTCEDAAGWQSGYLYSRASSIYGGSRQIQLNVIGRLVLSDPHNVGAVAPGTEVDEELAAVRRSVAEALESSPSARDALAGLDWWELAASPRDAIGRAAFSGWFEAQGRALATSPALAAVACSAVAGALETHASGLSLGLPGAADSELLVCGLDALTRYVVIDPGDTEARVVPIDSAQPATSGAFDAELLQALRVGDGAIRRVALDPAAHARATALARIAAACEILGAAGALLQLAAVHSSEREQFGQPIARFQAVQHLLSESLVDVSALVHLCGAALEEWSAGDAHALAMVTKAHAGRVGLAVAQRALQCFGAIGFTEEHAHHRYARRIHSLDAILGSHYALQRELGAQLVRTGSAPRGIEVWHPGGAADS